jgi:hypothetical protein
MFRFRRTWPAFALLLSSCGTAAHETPPSSGTSAADTDDTSADASTHAASDSTGDAGSTTSASTTGTTSSTTDPPETTTESTSEGSGDERCYEEPLDPQADIQDIVSAYGGADWQDEVIEAMDRRWPAGAFLLDAQRDDSYFSQFSDPNSWTTMVGWLDTLVHEETHLFNAYHAAEVGETQAMYFREDLILYLPSDDGFPRSEIMPLLAPPAAAGTYASTYLTGSQGQRGFNAMLDETLCYANEVPGLASFGEFYSGGVSLRDGSAAFLYFIEMYLRVARTDHPEFYAAAQAESVYVEAVLTLWLRAHFFYEEVGDDHPNLGINDAMYRSLAAEDDNLAEIEMFVGEDLDASSCIVSG